MWTWRNSYILKVPTRIYYLLYTLQHPSKCPLPIIIPRLTHLWPDSHVLTSPLRPGFPPQPPTFTTRMRQPLKAWNHPGTSLEAFSPTLKLTWWTAHRWSFNEYILFCVLYMKNIYKISKLRDHTLFIYNYIHDPFCHILIRFSTKNISYK